MKKKEIKSSAKVVKPKSSLEQKKVVKKPLPKTVTKTDSKSKDESQKKSSRTQTAEGWKRETMTKLGKPRPRKTNNPIS